MNPAAEAIRGQVDRLTSTALANSPRLCRFLRLVVEETLNGRQQLLKEYVVGVEVFDRPADFDPRLDSIVRVEAGRLRAKLRDYYQQNEDPLVIELGRRGYVPSFSQRSTAAEAQVESVPQKAAMSPAAARIQPTLRNRALLLAVVLIGAGIAFAAFSWRKPPAPQRIIAVLPFAEEALGADAALAARLAGDVAREFVRDGRLAVVPSMNTVRFAGTRSSAREVAASLGAELLLTGRVEQHDDLVRLSVLLIDTTLDRKIWVEEFAAQRSHAARLAPAVARKAATVATARNSGGQQAPE